MTGTFFKFILNCFYICIQSRIYVTKSYLEMMTKQRLHFLTIFMLNILPIWSKHDYRSIINQVTKSYFNSIIELILSSNGRYQILLRLNRAQMLFKFVKHSNFDKINNNIDYGIRLKDIDKN